MHLKSISINDNGDGTLTIVTTTYGGEEDHAILQCSLDEFAGAMMGNDGFVDAVDSAREVAGEPTHIPQNAEGAV